MGFPQIFKTQLVRKFNLANVSTWRNTFILLFFATNIWNSFWVRQIFNKIQRQKFDCL